MKKIITIVVIIIILIVIGVINNRDENGVAREVINIGSIETLTGNTAYYGEQTQKGILVAEEVIREKYPDFSFNIYHEDSQFTPQGGINAYNSLRVEKNIDAVISQASPVALAVKPLAEKDGILQMAAIAAASDYSTPDDLAFRVSAPTQLEAAPMADFIKSQGYQKLAILFFNNEIGVSMSGSLEEALKKVGGTEVVLKEGFLNNETDFRTLLLKVKEIEADAIYAVGIGSNLANIANQKTELGIDLQMLGFRTTEDPSLLEIAPENANGIIYTYNFDPYDPSKKVQEFSSRFQKMHGENPEGYSAESYLAALFTLDAFARCGKDYICIKSYLDGVETDSIFGDVYFDQNGDLNNNYFMKIVKDGKFVRLED